MVLLCILKEDSALFHSALDQVLFTILENGITNGHTEPCV